MAAPLLEETGTELRPLFTPQNIRRVVGGAGKEELLSPRRPVMRTFFCGCLRDPAPTLREELPPLWAVQMLAHPLFVVLFLVLYIVVYTAHMVLEAPCDAGTGATFATPLFFLVVSLYAHWGWDAEGTLVTQLEESLATFRYCRDLAEQVRSRSDWVTWAGRACPVLRCWLGLLWALPLAVVAAALFFLVWAFLGARVEQCDSFENVFPRLEELLTMLTVVPLFFGSVFAPLLLREAALAYARLAIPIVVDGEEVESDVHVESLLEQSDVWHRVLGRLGQRIGAATSLPTASIMIVGVALFYVNFRTLLVESDNIAIYINVLIAAACVVVLPMTQSFLVNNVVTNLIRTVSRLSLRAFVPSARAKEAQAREWRAAAGRTGFPGSGRSGSGGGGSGGGSVGGVGGVGGGGRGVGGGVGVVGGGVLGRSQARDVVGAHGGDGGDGGVGVHGEDVVWEGERKTDEQLAMELKASLLEFYRDLRNSETVTVSIFGFTFTQELTVSLAIAGLSGIIIPDIKEAFVQN